jgi:5-formyltetrahydrofolate cyclo-ligase
MLKSEIRKELLAKRKMLSESDCMKLDDLLLIQLQKLDWSTTAILGSFYPLEHQSEPNSFLLVKYLKYILPELQVAYPIAAPDFSMDFYEETDTLNVNKWGIHEPLPFNKIEPNILDTVLVPLVGFDQNGHRIGFGKGFYDRYFARCSKNIRRIGISYFEPVPKIIDTHQFDVPLTHCITPWTSYEFQ